LLLLLLLFLLNLKGLELFTQRADSKVLDLLVM